MNKSIKRYRMVILMLVVYSVVYLFNQQLFIISTQKTLSSMLEMALILPPIFILLGLLDVWVKRETMVKMMGKDSGIKGVLLAFLLGSAAAGPLYAAFPVALVLLKKGSSFKNVLIMIGAWSTTKIPMLMFEAASMGIIFTLTRFALDIFGILVIAWISERLLGREELGNIYKNSMDVD